MPTGRTLMSLPRLFGTTVDTIPGESELPLAATPLLRARSVHRFLGAGDARTHILKGVDLTVARGEYVSIVGASGSRFAVTGSSRGSSVLGSSVLSSCVAQGLDSPGGAQGRPHVSRSWVSRGAGSWPSTRASRASGGGTDRPG